MNILHLVKRARIEVEDETKKIVEGSNKGGIASANDNNGENMESDNASVLNECHLRTPLTFYILVLTHFQSGPLLGWSGI